LKVSNIEKKGDPEEPNDLEKSQNTFKIDAPYQEIRGKLKESARNLCPPHPNLKNVIPVSRFPLYLDARDSPVHL